VNISRRIDRLKSLLVADHGIVATFRNGTRRAMDGGDCIALLQQDQETVRHFEAQAPGYGLFPDLLNALIGD